MTTVRWEWGLDCSVWREALQHHYQHNPHHPQHYPGQPMEQRYLEESVVDMIGMMYEAIVLIVKPKSKSKDKEEMD